ncbi:hypothetical protein CTAM01_03544 [Colletotrichum tamarilloi]|uniref:NACHT domain-containing protein n=1 Tax=Colletotrichum tamarilloi TaxID=1209934 RepID=A0ABQ9RJZ8_9PEZI|nr:uncharacterized protein CTAM01_03544 [Colletotrichum tamarilloi]KAK1506209.1 hypothetical protein CTAM01_03544 [Colletotrichum tamarilloi]
MALLQLQRACERFRSHLSDEETRRVENVKSVEDVREAITQMERYLASRQKLRNFERLVPFLDAADRLTKPIDVLSNGVPFLPYIWAPLKLILQISQDHTHALDEILSAYSRIGASLPRFSRYGNAFPDSHDFQQLLGHIYEDIIDFHCHAYRLVQKPDREAASYEIVQARELRQKLLEEAQDREKKEEIHQREAVNKWLQVLRSICAQILDLVPETASSMYKECVVSGKTPSTSFLKEFVPKLFGFFEDLRLIIDGIDEIGSSEHGELIKTLAKLAETQGNFRLLISSQDIPSIARKLKGRPTLIVGKQSASVCKDIGLIVSSRLEAINEGLDGRVPESVFTEIRETILKRAEEDGPGATMVFIHATVPNGPFINKEDSCRDITTACIAQLTQSSALADEALELQQHLYCVAQGFYGLLPYADEYWIEHLLEYLELSQGFCTPDSSRIQGQLKALARNWIDLVGEESTRTSNAESPDSRLHWFESLPSTRALIQEALELRKATKESVVSQQSPQETSDYKSSVASAPSPSSASTPAAVQQAPQAMQLPEMEGGFLSKPQLGDPISQQVQDAAQQQQILPGVGSRAAPAKPAHQGLMDDMELKETLILTFRAQFNAPPEVRKWKDIWQWLEIHPIQPQIQQQLERIQAEEFSTRMQQEQEQHRQRQLQQRPPQLQQNGMPLNMFPNQDPPFQVTPRDDENPSYRDPRFADLPSDYLEHLTAPMNQDSIADHFRF